MQDWSTLSTISMKLTFRLKKKKLKHSKKNSRKIVGIFQTLRYKNQLNPTWHGLSNNIAYKSDELGLSNIYTWQCATISLTKSITCQFNIKHQNHIK
jgi:hypothetical protein